MHIIVVRGHREMFYFTEEAVMSRNRFTYLEALIVVAIVGVIAAIAIPCIQNAIAAAPQQQSAIKIEKSKGALAASYDMKTVETMGNHSWMPLNINS